VSYLYTEQRPILFSAAGLSAVLEFQKAAASLIKSAGAFTMAAIIKKANVGGDGWFLMACVDYLVEIEALREITDSYVAGQDRVFVAGRKGRLLP
jgi:hypothetical protein